MKKSLLVAFLGIFLLNGLAYACGLEGHGDSKKDKDQTEEKA